MRQTRMSGLMRGGGFGPRLLYKLSFWPDVVF